MSVSTLSCRCNGVSGACLASPAKEMSPEQHQEQDLDAISCGSSDAEAFDGTYASSLGNPIDKLTASHRTRQRACLSCLKMAQTGPPQQQLLQYHYQPQQLQQNSPQSLIETLDDGSCTGLWKTKLSLRISSFLACTVNIGLCIQIAISWSTLPICLFAPPAGIAACWNFIESISLCSHRDHRGFHPVICIVVDLLLWFGFTTSSVLMGVLGIEEDADYSGWYLNPEEADDFYYAALGMGILEILFHITLFVMTCYETHQQSIQPRIIYVQSGPNGAILISPLGYPITGQPQEGGLPQRNTENDRK
ncbi:hypothetical protein B0J15DRAFT_527500 [Fusarium solani]|uniref:Uncharacterized protein n=1 Tax=Fusarium solani TaxID=169388 RepID=A0A9P9KCP8_FUSSL|nr:uncharacterized protein B0J15DRAFT_527500 [Fusarium solani]KAH7248204.1 hypothetical protein B0J15DRAFT_527500 [Fusarium solani]